MYLIISDRGMSIVALIYILLHRQINIDFRSSMSQRAFVHRAFRDTLRIRYVHVAVELEPLD